MTTTLAPAKAPADTGTGDPLVGHISVHPSKRVALCGAHILGITAFGEFVHCATCDRLWNERAS